MLPSFGDKILIVDDARDIREPLGKFLAKNGFRPLLAANGAEARQILKRHAVDLVVLDIMMPGEDGLSLCQHLRNSFNMPVILLTAMAEEMDRIIGLEMGADDYVTKPFNPRELMARIKAVLRRANTVPRRRSEDAAGVLQFADWCFDIAERHVVRPGDAPVPLSTAEYKLLRVLIDRPQMELTREELLDLTTGREGQLFDRTIDNQISRLRKKLETNPKEPQIIKTVWGGGYVFAPMVERGT